MVGNRVVWSRMKLASWGEYASPRSRMIGTVIEHPHHDIIVIQWDDGTTLQWWRDCFIELEKIRNNIH